MLVIKEVFAAGYRSLRRIRFPVDSLSVFIGANGTGKTNLYRSLQLLQSAASGTLTCDFAAEGGFDSVYQARPGAGRVHARSHVERLLSDVPPHCGLVTVIGGHQATLAWMGSVMGHRTRSLGVEHFGQIGTVRDLYRHFGIDAQGIIAAAEMIAPGRLIRH